jgi:hypothetical protein
MFKNIVLAMAAVALACQNAPAQSDENHFEVGGQFSLLTLTTRTLNGGTLGEDQSSIPGFGGRFGYNFSKYFALESEVNFFPRDRDVEGGRKTQGLFGVKAGKRFERVGVFAKARPGFVRFEKGDYFQPGGCPQVFPFPLGCFRPVARTNFAIDLGGVIEVYPSKNTLIRFDAGDTIIRFGRRNVAVQQAPPFFGPTGLGVITRPAETSHNFQASAGFGFRF